MRVKEIERTANVAWSPAAQHPTYIAAGTAAQQLDATFSTSAALELYQLDLGEAGMDMDMVGSIPSDHRFHKLVWGSYGMETEEKPAGLIMAGADNGNLFVWNAANILKKEDALVHRLDKHSGAVAALDINPFQNNLLASGGSESEIYIWDLNNPASPMTPGAKSQSRMASKPPDDVTCIGWNRQVQHILASTYAGRCVVWDLRKNEPIIKVSDSMARIKCKLVSWHPEVATQMCLASEDDHTPVIQLWDLRFATSPLKLLENHQRGILSMAWCPQDPDLLLSCGKDNRILCWNPNTQTQSGEVVYELPTSNQWSFDVQWCPRNPALISSSSFDGHVSVYSLMGGTPPPRTPSKVADSFATDPFGMGPAQPAPAESQQSAAPVVLKKPPKWLRRPVGASFGFGGKLVTFEHEKAPAQQQQQQAAPARTVHVSQVVTETDLVARSNQLEAALQNNQLAEFCALKVANSTGDAEESIWKFLKVHFESDPRTQYLQLLGYNQSELAQKVQSLVDTKDTEEVTDKMAELDTSGASGDGDSEASAFDQIAASSQQRQQEEEQAQEALAFSTGDDCSGLVTRALLTADFPSAVSVCLHHNRLAEAIILAIAGGPDLLRQTQAQFFKQQQDGLSRLISSVVTRQHEQIMRTCDLANWREALALSLTYAKPDEFSSLCDILGSRLESEQDGALAWSACLCYICAGNVDRLVQCWTRVTHTNASPQDLQDLVEKVMLLRKAVERSSGSSQALPATVADKLSQYAEILAAEGSLNTAASYLGGSNAASLSTLRDRISTALGQPETAQKPFPVYNVQPEGRAPQPQAQPAAAQAPGQRQRTASGFHQAQAGSFQTTTTPTSSYYTPSYSTSQAGSLGSQVGQTVASAGYNYPAPTSAYNSQPAAGGAYSQPSGPYAPPPPPPASAAQAPLSKGSLSHKYPAYPQPTSSYDGYNASTPYSAAQYDGAASGASQMPPALYDPTTMAPAAGAAPAQHSPGAPYVPPSSAPYVPASAAAPPPPPPGQPLPPSFQDTKPACAWNDPPPLAPRKKKVSLSESNYEPPAPITAPIVGVPDQSPPGAPSYGGYYNPQQYQQQQQQQQQQAPVAQPAAPAPEPVKPKAPIPAEHQVLHDILQALADQCLAAAANPQTKRKLEDVLRKLEHLFDKLRAQALSGAVTGGLHQIVGAIQQYDYQSGLALYTQMVSQGNFSEISSFMPGLKILMQTAGHLQVYVQAQQ